MADILLLAPITGNYAEFKHPTNENFTLGTLYWDDPVYNEETGKYDVKNIYGTNVEGDAIDIGTLNDIPEEDRVNPTKVFWWIYKKMKSTLCPSCMNN